MDLNLDLYAMKGQAGDAPRLQRTVICFQRRIGWMVDSWRIRGFISCAARATKDLDVLIGADAENSQAVYAALAKFGAPLEGLSAKDFAEPDNFFRMGTPPVMVDMMPKITIS